MVRASHVTYTTSPHVRPRAALDRAQCSVRRRAMLCAGAQRDHRSTLQEVPGKEDEAGSFQAPYAPTENPPDTYFACVIW